MVGLDFERSMKSDKIDEGDSEGSLSMVGVETSGIRSRESIHVGGLFSIIEIEMHHEP